MIVLHGEAGEALCVRLDGDDDGPASLATHLLVELHVPGGMMEAALSPEAAEKLLAALPPLVRALGRSTSLPGSEKPILRPRPGVPGA